MKFKTKEIQEDLNEHLASYSILFHQYLKHAWLLAEDPYGRIARKHHDQVLEDLNALARASLSLGDVPLASPLEHVNRSYLEHEDEGLFSLPEMIGNNVEHEEAVIARLFVTLEATRQHGEAVVQATCEALLRNASARLGELETFTEETPDKTFN